MFYCVIRKNEENFFFIGVGFVYYGICLGGDLLLLLYGFLWL